MLEVIVRQVEPGMRIRLAIQRNTNINVDCTDGSALDALLHAHFDALCNQACGLGEVPQKDVNDLALKYHESSQRPRS